MKYRLVETKEIIDRILAFSESHSDRKYYVDTIGRIIEMYQEYPAVFRRLYVYEVVPNDFEENDNDPSPYLTALMKSFRTNYIFIKAPSGVETYEIPDTLKFSQNDLKCMQRMARANPILLRWQCVYSKWDLEWSWSQSSFFSIFLQMLWSIKGDLMKGGAE